MLDSKNKFSLHGDAPSILVHSGERDLTPAVSIMIPTFRRPALLRETIASALAQSADVQYEVMVVDNEQDEEMAKLVNDVVLSFNANNLHLYRNSRNLGMFGNWNRCIELARGDWLTILNDDDLLMPDFLAEALPELKGRALVAADADHFGAKHKLRAGLGATIRKLARGARDFLFYKHGKRQINESDLFFGNPVRASLGVLLNKHACVEIGGYDEKLWPIADYAFTVGYCRQFGGYLLNKKLVKYRVEENESLKPATVVGFVEKNDQLRSWLMSAICRTRFSSKVLGHLSRWLKAIQTDYYIKVFSLAPSRSFIYQETKASGSPLPLVEYVAVAFEALLKCVFALGFRFGQMRRMTK